MRGGRSPPPYLLIPEYQTRTHTTTTTITALSLPLSTHNPNVQVQTCLQFAICSACAHTHILALALSLLPSISLSVSLPSFLLPSLSRARPGSRQRSERTAGGGLRELWLGCRAAGSRAALVTEYDAPAGSLPAAEPQPRSPGPLARSLTPAPSCSATLPSLCNRVLPSYAP